MNKQTNKQNETASKQDLFCTDAVDIPKAEDVEQDQASQEPEGSGQPPCEDASDEELIELLKQKQESVEDLNRKLAEMKDAQLRSRAEFDNFRKRTQKEKQELYQSAMADCVLEFLPVLDNLERAMQAPCAEQDTFKSGVEMTLNQFKEALAKLGVEEIEAQGKEFDPNSHNAVQTIEDQELGENVVCQVFQKGYAMGEKVLRHAMVVVANP